MYRCWFKATAVKREMGQERRNGETTRYYHQSPNSKDQENADHDGNSEP
jgi:hypothetical protein